MDFSKGGTMKRMFWKTMWRLAGLAYDLIGKDWLYWLQRNLYIKYLGVWKP
jgi:hypothetical protein